MFQVRCPGCQKTREVQAKKKWMTGEEPFFKLCPSCCQVGKPKTEEHRQKLSESVKAAQTEELLAAKSEYRKAHPETWQGKLRGQGDTFVHSEETKRKIGEGVKHTKKKGKGGS